MKYDRIDKELFVLNRKNFVEQMDESSLAVFNSNDIFPISADSTMPFEQQRDLFYFLGSIKKRAFWYFLQTQKIKHIEKFFF